jgi:hypothetical protein
MNPKLRYILKTLNHKWWVFRYGLRTKAPLWRLVIHDWTKFTSAELPFYANHLYGGADDPIGFALAWNHHSKLNPHHHEFWIPVSTHMKSTIPAGEPLPMPDWAVREMVADWLGAERSYNKVAPKSLASWAWHNQARDEIRLHPDTELLVDGVLAEYFAAYGD